MTPGSIGLIIAIALVAVMALIVFVRAHVVVCSPNEAVIFSGRVRKQPDGTRSGLRILRGGRGFRMPIVETVSRIPLNTIPIEIKIDKALSGGMIPLQIDGLATVKVSGDEKEGLPAAVERFLGRSTHEIQGVARETIEGSLRGVIATLVPEEANANRLRLAADASAAASADLAKLGLVLDTFQIQSLSDAEGYLEAIGRRKNAEVLKNARIAEARAESEARNVQAEAKRDAVLAETDADRKIVDAEHGVRMLRAARAAELNRAEEVAEQARNIARAEEELRLETARVSRNERQQEADVIVPAKAEQEANERRAQGRAAKIRENGAATAEALARLREQWTDEDTREIMLLQMLPHLVDKVTEVLKDNLHVERLTVVDGGDGKAIGSHVGGVTHSVVAFFEELRTATGVDVPAILRRVEKK